MSYYGAPGNPFGQNTNAAAPSPVGGGGANVRMPNAQDMAGAAPVPWVRAPFYPTAPFYSTNPNVGYQTRYYSEELISTDTDYSAGTEAIRTIQFDIPCRLIAINGAAFSTAAGNALPVGVGPRDCWMFRAEYTQGDRLHVSSRIASTVVGTAQRPGEIGGAGWTINSGASFVLGITPLLAGLRINVTLVCLEMRGPSNYTRG
jgi:hypothetical protein